MLIKILFVCHGSICRSPMAKFVFQDMVDKAGLTEKFYIDCAAMTYEEIGNPVYPPVRQVLNSKGIDCSGYAARHIKKDEYREFDYIIGMDAENMHDLHYEFPDDYDNKIYRLLDFTERPRDISDPWYTRQFEKCYDEVLEGCKGLLDTIVQKGI